MTTKYTDQQIEEAVRNEVWDWDIQSLIDYVVEDLYNYYTLHADPDDLELFMQENKTHGEEL